MFFQVDIVSVFNREKSTRVKVPEMLLRVHGLGPGCSVSCFP